MSQPSIITSVQNPQVKRVRRLHEAKGRRQEGLFLLEGMRLLAEARRSCWEVVEVFSTPRGAEKLEPGVSSTLVSEHVLACMSTLETPEGVLALARMPAARTLPDISIRSFWVACERIQDPGNLGTIIRTADAAGAEAILVGPGTADAFGPKVVRASMGSVLHLPIVPFADAAVLRETTKAAGMRWAAAVPRTGRTLYEVDLAGALCWWIGNEAQGLSLETVAMAELQLEIPMPGRAESLNAASAAAICLFETVRQRQQT